MKWLQGTWAVRFNRFQGEIGRPFQGRYKAFNIEPGQVLAQVAHYIHLNPFDAGLVALDCLADYRWSSLHALKTLASVSNRWVAERLGMGGASSVSSLVTRFQREGGADTPAFRRLCSRFAS